MANEKTVKTLEQEDAIELWLQGKDVWNAWVEEHPVCNIDFSGVDFFEYRNSGNRETISFKGFHFPKGNVNFSGAQFGNGGVYFTEAQFGDGNVYFSNARFGEGDVDFFNARFDKGDVYFSNARFDKGNVYFSGARFGEGNVTLSRARFGEGDVYFFQAQFGEGKYSFERLKFKGQVFFTDLKNVENVTGFSFKYSTFDNSLDISSKGVFGCIIDLTSTRMSHQVSLSDLKCTLRTKENTPKPRIFSIIDRLPKFLKNEKQNGEWLYNNIAEDEKDAERARRLKEITANNKNHQKSLDFHALEMQAERKPNPLPKSFHGFSKLILTFLFLAYAYIPVFLLMYHPISFFSYPPIYMGVFYFVIKHFPFLLVSEFWYQKCSDYGRSIIRPLIGMAVIWFLFSFVYLYVANEPCDILRIRVLNSSVYSFTQMFSFIPSTRGASKDMLKLLFVNASPPSWLYFIASFQTILSIILLFLLSLGLKNKFRI